MQRIKAIKLSRTSIWIIVGVALLLAAGLYLYFQQTVANSGLIVSGYIEATQVHLGAKAEGTINGIFVAEGDKVKQGQVVAVVGNSEQVRSPIDGVVLDQAMQSGEIAMPGGTIVTVGDLQNLTLTVYVPEERLGEVSLGQAYPVTVDAFPDTQFTGQVSYISDQAEFTPRNVQTVEGRKDTVYAVRLLLSNPDMALKPGMPADVTIEPK
jgi:multidrug efflux pump subunit AcrA (membrane-fusion protein)